MTANRNPIPTYDWLEAKELKLSNASRRRSITTNAMFEMHFWKKYFC